MIWNCCSLLISLLSILSSFSNRRLSTLPLPAAFSNRDIIFSLICFPSFAFVENQMKIILRVRDQTKAMVKICKVTQLPSFANFLLYLSHFPSSYSFFLHHRIPSFSFSTTNIILLFQPSSPSSTSYSVFISVALLSPSPLFSSFPLHYYNSTSSSPSFSFNTTCSSHPHHHHYHPSG